MSKYEGILLYRNYYLVNELDYYSESYFNYT